MGSVAAETASGGVTIDFGSHFAASELFTQIFSEGMALVEEAADYLDGEGRAALRALDRTSSLTYASESMRLTTRLMQLASWLLLQRAVKEGELSKEDARREKQRINLKDIGGSSDTETVAELPDGLQNLIRRSLHLHQRVLKLDRMIYDHRPQTRPQQSPVNEQMMLLRQAFGR
ncbi:DUF1465 family protein [Rhodoligotrophos ferricapiens]|uniref:protease adaptor protein RcdA n=1 Tax=Rhodoligotrophos ferricapiens TaxID=3069264 RepID=UPI00315CF806